MPKCLNVLFTFKITLATQFSSKQRVCCCFYNCGLHQAYVYPANKQKKRLLMPLKKHVKDIIFLIPYY